jgi:uncharacterized protein YqhQ
VIGCSPACCAVASARLPVYGGQAVMEGVMMRGQRYVAVAVRSPSQEIVVRTEELPPRLYQSRIARIPFLRGSLMIWDALVLGMRALMFSADVHMGEQEAKLSRPVTWSTMGVGLLIGTGLFFVLPLLLTGLVHDQLGSSLAANILEGVVRIAFIMIYVGVIGLAPDIARVYMHHGAEHKAINAFEAGSGLAPVLVLPFSIRHPRCGTNFLLIVAVLAVMVMAPLGRDLPWAVLIASRIVLIPVVAGLAYEAIRWGAAHLANPIVALAMKPGMAMQTLTTREPDESQVEVAARALREVIHLEHPEHLTPEDALVPVA